jgi:hypothetical protein
MKTITALFSVRQTDRQTDVCVVCVCVCVCVCVRARARMDTPTQ